MMTYQKSKISYHSTKYNGNNVKFSLRLGLSIRREKPFYNKNLTFESIKSCVNEKGTYLLYF